MDLEAVVTEALAALSGYVGDDALRLANERRSDVAEWRWPAGGTSPHRPEPWSSERAGKEGAWLDGPPSVGGLVVGLDVGGRPVLAEVRFAGTAEAWIDEVWVHGDGWSDVVTPAGAARIVFADGRPAAKISRTSNSVRVETWDWEDNRPVRSIIGAASPGHTLEEIYVADFEADGRLRTLKRGVDTPPRGELELVPAALAAHTRAAQLVPDHEVFDARTGRQTKGLRSSDDVIALLGPAIADAVVAAATAAGVERPFVVTLRLSDDRFPPFVRVGGERFRERTIALTDESPLRLLYKAEPPDGATVELVEHLDDNALEACRELNWALSHELPFDHPERRRAGEICERLGRDWALDLNRRDWPDSTDSFLVLVEIGRQFEEVDPFELALPAVGRERIDAFRASIASHAATADLPVTARTDVAALEAELMRRGLGTAATRVAALAQPAFRLLLTGGDVGTRLGGPGLLPPGEVWPQARGGRPLSFLAAVDLSELPPSTPLPADGSLLFFADLDNDEALGLIEPVANEPEAPARLYHVPAGAEPVAAEAPPGTLALSERRVVPVPQLTLPDDYELGERLGLDPAATSVCEQVAYDLRHGTGRSEAEEGDHWILGAVTGAQGHPTEPGTVLLLHMAWDESLGFEFLDGGVIQFRIPEAALIAGDWGAVTIEPDSG